VRVLLDATAVPGDRGGVGRYVDELVPALARTGIDLVVACQPRDTEVYGAVAGVDVVPAPGLTAGRPGRMAWEQVGLPALARRTGADLLHSPHYTMPRRPGLPVAVTLHDATFFSHPQLHSPLKARFFRAATRAAVRRAAVLVVPSQATGAEVARFAGAPRGGFQVAYHGVDAGVFHRVGEAEQARVAATLGLDGRPYIAFLGTLEPRKNVPALVGAWTDAVAGTDDPPALVLAGGRGWDTDVDPAVAAVPPSLRVVRPGYLPLGDLAGFLAGARFVAYPSLGEGFGLPVLEAMACGAAVLTTRELALPEVGGDAVAYCGTSRAEIAAGIRGLLDDDARRRDLAARAVERAASFTWDASAAAHVEAYRAALAGT
jgi:glycosyltransferase involved in cell wall biosynthesis